MPTYQPDKFVYRFLIAICCSFMAICCSWGLYRDKYVIKVSSRILLWIADVIARRFFSGGGRFANIRDGCCMMTIIFLVHKCLSTGLHFETRPYRIIITALILKIIRYTFLSHCLYTENVRLQSTYLIE